MPYGYLFKSGGQMSFNEVRGFWNTYGGGEFGNHMNAWKGQLYGAPVDGYFTTSNFSLWQFYNKGPYVAPPPAPPGGK